MLYVVAAVASVQFRWLARLSSDRMHAGAAFGGGDSR